MSASDRDVTALPLRATVDVAEIAALQIENARLRREVDLLYGELNVALGSHAPKAWERVAAKLKEAK